MSNQKPPETPVEKRYQLTVQVLAQIIIFLLGYVVSEPVSEIAKIEPVLVFFVVGVLSFAIYFLPYSQFSSSNTVSIPGYWNTRINALSGLWLQFQGAGEPFKSTVLKLYVSGLEMNYEAALIEGREALAKRFRELIDKYEKQLKQE